MKKVPIEELMKQTFPNGVFVDSEGFDIRYRFDGEDYPIFINEIDSHEAAVVVAHCLNTHQMLLDALKYCAKYLKKTNPRHENLPIHHEALSWADEAIESASFVEVQE